MAGVSQEAVGQPSLTDDERAMLRELAPPLPAVARAYRAFRSLFYRLPDTGLFGLTPLQSHLVVCGFPRSGTTLLLAMLEHGYPHARQFAGEEPAWRAACQRWRNHALMISKLPKDILRLDALRAIYRRRRGVKLRIVILIRDPRDMLTSRHAGTTDREFFVDATRFRLFNKFVRKERGAQDVLVLKYEDLVRDVAAVQSQIEAFFGHGAEQPFATFHTVRRKNFDAVPLNGLRPVDASNIGRWATEPYRERMNALLKEMPDLTDTVVEMGYETSPEWVHAWRKSFRDSQAVTSTAAG